MARNNWRGTFVMRLSSEEKGAIDKRAQSLGVTTSSLVRALACIPIEFNIETGSGEAPSYVVFDRVSMARLSQAVSTYGSLYSQACKSYDALRCGYAVGDGLSDVFANLSLSLELVSGGLSLVEGIERSVEDNAVKYFNKARADELRSIAKADCDSFISTRLSDDEKARVERSAKSLGVATSSLVRALACLPIQLAISGDAIETPPRICFDAAAISRLTQTINTYGSLFNQATKSLNTIAKHGARNRASLRAALGRVSISLEAVAAGMLEIKEDARQIEGHEMVYLETADGRSAKW